MEIPKWIRKMAEQDPSNKIRELVRFGHGRARHLSIPVLESHAGAAAIRVHGADEIVTAICGVGDLLIDGVPASPEKARTLIGTQLWIDLPGAGRRLAIASWEDNDHLGCRLLQPLVLNPPEDRRSAPDWHGRIARRARSALSSAMPAPRYRTVDLQLSIIEDERRYADVAYLKFACLVVALSICMVAYAMMTHLLA